MIQLDIKIEIILYIFYSIWELDIAIIKKAHNRNSVSNFAFIATCSISSEGQQTGPLYIFIKWVDDQIKTDTEEWTPTANSSNFLVLKYFSRNIKAVVNIVGLPQEISKTGISGGFEFVSSKRSNIGENLGISILNTVNFSSINCNSKKNLR